MAANRPFAAKPWCGLLSYDAHQQPLMDSQKSMDRGVATCTQIRNCVPENNNKKINK